MSLYASARVAYQYLLALYSSEIFLVAFFYTKVTCIVSALIIRVTLDIGIRNFPYIAEDIGGHRTLIFAKYAFLDIETRETIHFFLQSAIVLGVEVCHEGLRRI